jgi:hypothetical protein
MFPDYLQPLQIVATFPPKLELELSCIHFYAAFKYSDIGLLPHSQTAKLYGRSIINFIFAIYVSFGLKRSPDKLISFPATTVCSQSQKLRVQPLVVNDYTRKQR